MRLLTVNPTTGNPVRSCYAGIRVCYDSFMEGNSCVKLQLEAVRFSVPINYRGRYSGHYVVCLKDSEGKLWVGESGHGNEKG